MSAETKPSAEIDAPIRSFLTGPPRYATIATINPDGSPHQIVIWYLLHSNEQRGDHLVVNSKRGRRWPTNLERDGRANLTVFEAEDAVTFECHVEQIYDDERAQANIAEMALRYDEPEMAQREIARFRTEARVSFILRLDRVLIHGSPS